MSAEDLASFLREKMGEQRASNTDMVRRINISRRTWYRLLNADIEEAKLSTLVKLASAMDVSVTQLVEVYFNNRSLGGRSNNRKHSVQTNLPSNSLVVSGQPFVKTWEVKNLSKEHWVGLTLRCIDETLLVKVLDSLTEESTLVAALVAKSSKVSIPDTRVGETVSISMDFLAPDQAGTTVSHWRFFRDEKQLKGAGYPQLNCLVKVVEAETQSDSELETLF